LTSTETPTNGNTSRFTLGRALISYLILPNAVFLIVGGFGYMSRPLVNLDYLFLGAVAGLMWPPAAIGVYALLVAVDAFVSLAPVFHFGLENAVVALPFVFQLGWGAALLALLCGIGVAAVAVVGMKVSGERRGRWRPSLLVGALLLFVLDGLNGTSGLFGADRARVGFNIATSAVYTAGRSAYQRTFGREKIVAVASSTETLRGIAASDVPHESLGATDIILVIVESLGHFKDSMEDSVVLGPLLSPNIRQLYTIRTGTVPTRGATTSGELRELCGVRADFRDVNRIDLQTCLPSALRGQGFRTVAIHGYSGAFFDRYKWYAQLGFERVLFAEDLARMGVTGFCGATFQGLRDLAVGRVVEREVLAVRQLRERRFVYWMTLSSHLPVDASCATGTTLPCPQDDGRHSFQDVCTLMQIQRLVAQSVAEIAANPALSPTRFIVVGDHPPPFFSRNMRSQFAENDVPFIELIPKRRRSTDLRAH